LNSRSTEKGIIVGTPLYIPPEMLEKEGVSASGKEADIWSLGVLLYMLLTDDKPFNGRCQRDLFNQVKSGRFFMPTFLSKNC
jgi:5'-AMP-activated protein kinase catalytic alpha subunit